MDRSIGLLEKMALLGRRLLPKGAALAGGAIGGPAGAMAGQAVGSGLEQLMTPSQGPYSGMGMPITQGMPMQQNEEQDRLTRVLGSLAGNASYGGAQAAGNYLTGGGMGQEGGGDEWSSLIKQLMQEVPREELMQFLQSRSAQKMGSELEG